MVQNFSQLPAEIMSFLFEHVRQFTPVLILCSWWLTEGYVDYQLPLPEIKAMSLCCRDLRGLALHYVYRSIELNFAVARVSQTEASLQFLIAGGPSPVQHVQIITISGHKPNLTKASIELLRELLRKVDELKEIRWDVRARIPNAITEDLHALWPNSRLRLRQFDGELETGVDHEPLVGSPCLFELHCFAGLTKRASSDNIKRIIFSCPNLRILDLSSLHSIYHPGPGYPFELGPTDRLPPLQELRLKDFWCTPDQYKKWVQSIDWEALRHLSLQLSRFDSFLPLLRLHLPELHSLEIQSLAPVNNHPQTLSMVSSFLKMVPNLQTFSSHGFPPEILFQAAEYHGSHLQCLSWIGLDSGAELMWNLPAASLKRLHPMLPELRSLTISIDRSEDWPYDVVKEISGFRKLCHLHLVAPPIDSYATGSPLVYTPAACKQLFIYLDSNSRNDFSNEGSQNLETLDIEAGDWGLDPYSYYAWRRNPTNQYFKCSRRNGAVEERQQDHTDYEDCSESGGGTSALRESGIIVVDVREEQFQRELLDSTSPDSKRRLDRELRQRVMDAARGIPHTSPI
ncbi:hypothetical protein PRK78_006828 [Emydomyces testavorans]|uniref:F-box domain-containing protein n=1 Tax=Emydomyces testavorans TaxID=2070801 RepID=A0AAF0DMY5_9EURO|nr:hypothetical protein PRK78_006828 [Emydomyces testavorans]